MHTSDKSPSRPSRLRLARRGGVAALVGLACVAPLSLGGGTAGALSIADRPRSEAARAVAPSYPPDAAAVAAKLRRIPGLRVVSTTHPAEVPGAVLYTLTYRQPADHHKPKGRTFQQRLTLLQRFTADHPTELYTSGYALRDGAAIDEPARLIDGNQVSVEHRWFGTSRPEKADWSKLTIWQAATDFHRIVRALRPVLTGRWISAGHSKGGMTTVYDRRFYPNDVDGSVAYVAPNDVDNQHDVYVPFLERAGNDPACNRALTALQVRSLKHRSGLVKLFKAALAENKQTVKQAYGSVDAAFEAAVVDTSFAFWQYLGQDSCALVPGPKAKDSQVYAFMDMALGWSYYTDQGAAPYLPYYYQAASQLGWPDDADDPHFRGLLHSLDLGSPAGSLPKAIRPRRFDAKAMADVDRWVRTHGNRLLFVYGEDDPWSAEPFQLGLGSRNSAVYWVPGGNHSAEIRLLPERDGVEATATLRSWARRPAGAAAATASLDGARAAATGSGDAPRRTAERLGLLP